MDQYPATQDALKIIGNNSRQSRFSTMEVALHFELNDLLEKAKVLEDIKAVMDLPETSIGETFTKLAKIKEIVEGME